MMSELDGSISFDESEAIKTCYSIESIHLETAPFEVEEERDGATDSEPVVDAEKASEKIPESDGQPTVIALNEKTDPATGTRELTLPGGNKVLVHTESAYSSCYPVGTSFETLTGEGDAINFHIQFKLHRDGVKAMGSSTGIVQSNTMLIYHSNVLWAYTYSFIITSKDNEEVQLTFQLQPHGNTPSLLQDADRLSPRKGAVGTNEIPGQKAPPTRHETLVIGPHKYVLKKVAKHYECEQPIPLSLLQECVKESPYVVLAVSLTVPRAYFDISNYYTTPSPQTEVIAPTRSILQTILAGERPPGADLVISVGGSDNNDPKEGGGGTSSEERRDFHVHKQVLAHASPTFEAMLRTHGSLGALAWMVSSEQRMILPTLEADDMQMLLTYVYGRHVLLPPFDGFARLGRFLTFIFGREQLDAFLTAWQGIMVNELNKCDVSKSSVDVCVRHLIGIYSAPYGAFPIAKRLAVAKLADIIQVHYGSMNALKGDLKAAYEPYEGHLKVIMASAEKFRTLVTSTRKELCD